jgi:hypothetical protein
VTPAGVTFSAAGEHLFGYWSVTCSALWNVTVQALSGPLLRSSWRGWLLVGSLVAAQ